MHCAGAYENLAASGTEVRTLVVATVSRNVGGAPLSCPSTGRLEHLLHQGIHRELGDTIRR